MTKPQLPPGVIPIGATHFHHNPVIEKPTSNPWRKKCGEGWLAFYDGKWRGCNGSKANLFVAIEDVLGKANGGEWDGDGLPPVGVVCEHKDYGGVTILAHGVFRGTQVVVAQGDDTIVTATADFYFPFRTAEQIAAEERDKAIQQMIDDTNILTGIMSDRRIMAAQLYDAGYRKIAE